VALKAEGTDPTQDLEALNVHRLGSIKADFLRFLLADPKFDDFEIERDTDTGRDIDLSDFV
jgi:hypothetical protein